MSEPAIAMVKCREIGKARFAFLTPGSNLSPLRIHAATFSSWDKARALIEANADDNPEWEFKVVPAIARPSKGR